MHFMSGIRDWGLLGSLVEGLGLAPVASGQTDAEAIEQGRYLIRIAGCNDCHTPGYLMSDGQVPEELWLTGDSFGWSGTWGTTYPPNLRLRLHELSEDQWVTYAQALKARPPMPWFNLNRMKGEDLRAIHKFVRHLGPAGTVSPPHLPPGVEPPPPFALFPPPPPGK